MPSQLIYKIHLLTFGEGRRSTDVFHFQNRDEDLSGNDNFFLFFDYADFRHLTQRDIKKIRDLIVSKIEEQNFSAATNQDTCPAFERMMRELNSILPPLLPSSDPLHQSLTILIAHIRSDAVSFGYSGEPDAFFIRPKSSGDGLMLQIFEKKDQREIPSPSLFAHIISGKISSGDILFLATPNVLDYLSQEKIKRTLLSLSPQPAAELLKTLLAEARKREKFGMIIVKAIASLPAKQPTSHRSIEEFIGKKTNTQTILSPQFSELAKASFQKVTATAKNFKTSGLALIKQMFPKKRIVTNASIPKFEELNAKPHFVKNDLLKNLLNKINSFPPSQKRLLLIISALVVVLIIGVIFSFNERSQKTNLKETSKLQGQIEEKVVEAEAAMIINNSKSAREAFDQIAFDLKTPEGEAFSKNPANRDILNRYDIIRQKIFHLVSLGAKDNQSVTLSFESNSSPERIIFSGKRLVILDSSGKFYSLDADKKTQTPFSNQPDQKPSLIAFSKNTIAGLNDIIIEQYDQALKKSSIKIDPLPARAISAINFFNDKLYLLVADERQIYVYGKSGDSYKQIKKWIDSGEDELAGIIDFAIDGEIFALKNDGTIKKFSKNKPADFSLDPVEYQISPSRIMTPNESAPLYILDKTAGRIIVYDKSGKLVTQYIADQAIVDAAVNDSNGSLAVLYEKEVQVFKLK